MLWCGNMSCCSCRVMVQGYKIYNKETSQSYLCPQMFMYPPNPTRCYYIHLDYVEIPTSIYGQFTDPSPKNDNSLPRTTFELRVPAANIMFGVARGRQYLPMFITTIATCESDCSEALHLLIVLCFFTPCILLYISCISTLCIATQVM